MGRRRANGPPTVSIQAANTWNSLNEGIRDLPLVEAEVSSCLCHARQHQFEAARAFRCLFCLANASLLTSQVQKKALSVHKGCKHSLPDPVSQTMRRPRPHAASSRRFGTAFRRQRRGHRPRTPVRWRSCEYIREPS